jgi:Methyltransferase domain
MTRIYLPPSIQRFEPRRVVFSTWIDHQPFGYDLVTALGPRLLVELGTHTGLSFFTFCQAMKESGAEGLCYAVDTFEGDAHTGGYDDAVFRDVEAHAREHYPGFTYLLRTTFAEAARHFSDETIDLLHIDGLHTYEAVSGDFATWLPKVRPGGIVLFHDVQARIEGFGVWRFWEEARGRYESFTFEHGFGLGVLRKAGGDRSADPELVDLLFADRSEVVQSRLRAFYVHAGEYLVTRRRDQRVRARAAAKAATAGGRRTPTETADQ